MKELDRARKLFIQTACAKELEAVRIAQSRVDLMPELIATAQRRGERDSRQAIWESEVKRLVRKRSKLEERVTRLSALADAACTEAGEMFDAVVRGDVTIG